MGGSWGPFRVLWGPRASWWGPFRASWGTFMAPWGLLGASWGSFGGPLGLFWDLEARLHTWGWGLTPLRARCSLPVLWDCSTLPPPPPHLPLPWALWFPCPSLSQQHPKVPCWHHGEPLARAVLRGSKSLAQENPTVVALGGSGVCSLGCQHNRGCAVSSAAHSGIPLHCLGAFVSAFSKPNSPVWVRGGCGQLPG